MVDLNSTNSIANGDYYYGHDHLYSPAVLFYEDGTGAEIVERYEYDAYGKVQVLTDSDGDGTWFDDAGDTVYASSQYGNPYTFTGRRLDVFDYNPMTHEHGYEIMYYRARYYDTETGRFIQRDMLEYIDGMNLYEYTKSNLLIRGDALGLSSDIEACIDKCLDLPSGKGREECSHKCTKRTHEEFEFPSMGGVVDHMVAMSSVSNGIDFKFPPIETPYGDIEFSISVSTDTRPCCSNGNKGVLQGVTIKGSGKICIGPGGGITKNTFAEDLESVFDLTQKGFLPCKGSQSGKLSVVLGGKAGAIVTGGVSAETTLLPTSKAWDQDYNIDIGIGLWAGSEVCIGIKANFKKIWVIE